MSEKNFNLLILLSLKSICSFKKCYIMKHKTILLLASLFVVGIACKQFDREFSVNTNIDYCEAQALRTLAIVPSGSEGGIPNSIDGEIGRAHV